MWSATYMGLASGLIFVISVPSPAPYLLWSTTASGFFSDLVILATASSYSAGTLSNAKILAATVVSGVAESIVALSLFTALGCFKLPLYLLGTAWTTDIALNIVLSIAGALITIYLIMKKRKAPTPVRAQVSSSLCD